MPFLSLDISKRSTGWALWRPGLDRPVSGAWTLGSEYTTAGETFIKMHRQLNDLHQVEGFDQLSYEQPLNLGIAGGNTNADTLFVLIGLAAHVRSFCAAKGIRRCADVNMATWRKHFIGPMKRGTRTADLKDYAMQRCREFGLSPRTHDEAEAIGILSYALSLEGIIPPWEADHVLRAPLGRPA